ncbi:hypothetical protein CDES_09500 [Corynebacterium deserti GIMN1.010]|uniref:Secreted protein n=1 Tax=Corynebacterium deserti GIMN1.010 TaxID=931089 RepID=A0A0M4CK63_9CORY|nr:hypothetical protein [Corynebacterium deserti]ALC06288.1 hypothetical protein CDES_09500 [Corynebacterium deserti GIMN1.010]
MSIRITSKKVACAAFMATPLFLAACGSDSADTEAASTTEATTTSTTKSSTSSTASSTESTESTVAETTEAPAGESAESSVNAEEQAQLDALQQELIQNPITVAEAAPVENGQAASPEDAAAIESLIRGSAEATTLRSSFGYMINNTCSRVLEASGANATPIDLNSIPDVPLGGDGTGTVDSVSDIAVQGDTASAWVVATAGGTTDSATQRFQREGGQWKFCD